MWRDMIGALESLAEAYERLVAIGKAKRDTLVAIDMKRLEKLLDAEQTVLDEIQQLENGRQKILKSLSEKEPKLRPEMTMQEVLAVSPGEIRPQLKGIHKKLDDVVAQAKTVSGDNAFLIQGALSAVNYHLNRLSNAEVEQGYGQRGQEIVTRQKKFDFQA
ncbi:MAG: flagellar protein FlgN [Schwartzia sp.]|nr:flagellar protein FlgN [Schwartzia sp. (in: firmicutes)]